MEVDWASMLSVGEQQRLAFARLLHQPIDLAFLDEATSGLDAETEAVLYSLLAQRGIGYVSVGHRAQLLRWHTHVLENVGNAQWRLVTAGEYAAGQQDQPSPVERWASAPDISPGSLSTRRRTITRLGSTTAL